MGNFSPFVKTFRTTLENTWPMLTLFVVIIVVLRLTYILLHHEKIVLYKEFYYLLAIVYILLLYYLLLSTENASSGINVIPFKEITRYDINSKLFMYNVIGNIVLFIPFGFFVSYYLKAKKVSHIGLISIIISLTAELIQFKIGRAFDVDDVILNVFGSLIGFLFYICINAVKNHLPSFLRNNIFYNIIAIIVFLVLLVLFGSVWGIKI